MKKSRLLILLLLLAVCAGIWFFSQPGDAAEPAGGLTLLPTAESAPTAPDSAPAAIDEDGSFDSAEDVALYLHTYGRLPKNYITKAEAQKLGWSGGSVERVAPGCCIGGGRFGNNEGLLPAGEYRECDIDTLGADSRGPKRLVYSDNGCIYYTADHYESFTLLYGDPA